jgi:multidrug efflux pump subunit AcrA (membrane-fusion protein)
MKTRRLYQNLPNSVIHLRAEEHFTALQTTSKSSDKGFDVVSKNIRRLSLLAAIILLALIFSGCSRKEAEKKPVEETGLPVEVVKASLEEMIREIPLTGTIMPIKDSTIGVELSARVLEVNVTEGDMVRAGQVLVRLDDSAARARLQQAKAALTAAQKRLFVLKAGARTQERAVAKMAVAATKANVDKAALDLERSEELFKQGAVALERVDSDRNKYAVAMAQYESAKEQYSLMETGARKEEIEAAQADVKQAQAAVKLAQNDLAHTVLRAPITGLVYYKNIDVGQFPGTGDAVLKIATLNQVYFEATVPEKDLSSLSPGQQVNISVDALSGEQFAGRIERFWPTAGRDFLARIAVINPKMELMPSMFARGNVLVEKHPRAIVVPKDALLDKDNGKMVYVVENNQALQRKVTLGLTNASLVEITSGVKEGEEVVVSGQQGLSGGEAVSITRR